MNLKFLVKHLFGYLRDSSIDIRTRMMYFLEYASLVACFVGTIAMVLLKQPVSAMLPNFVLFIMSFLGLYFSHVKKQYDLSASIVIIGCANIALPWMFFSAGGNQSGMIIWFMFAIVVICLMAKGRIRIILLILTILQYFACITIGHFYPNTVTPLVGEHAEIVDVLQSFAIVCICIAGILSIYITTYDKQRKQLEAQSIELKNMMRTDALTGAFNRHAYYEEIKLYKETNETNDLVLVAMDVNGLKKINDKLGHSAGDDYIRSAAKVINQALGQYGHIFRTGGDEFMALLHCSANETTVFESRIDECIDKLDNPWPVKMTIAIGIVCWNEIPDKDLAEVEKLADKRMYENKAEYYRKNGIDRRR